MMFSAEKTSLMLTLFCVNFLIWTFPAASQYHLDREISFANVSGVQIAGVKNWTGNSKGVQIAGVFNISERSQGLQIAGCLNRSSEETGSQISGVVNIGGKVKGIQIAGLLNVADSSDYPIGLINIIKNGRKSIAVGTDESGSVNFTFRSGGRVLYGLTGIGFYLTDHELPYAFDAGMGIV